MINTTHPDQTYEIAALTRGHRRVVGIDEVGRGPFAGPVVAAAVVLDLTRVPEGMRDSKKLSAKKRDQLFKTIMDSAEVGVGIAEVGEIDQLNILQATFLAMRRAVEALPRRPDFALIDGKLVPPGLNFPADCLVKGDDRSVSIAAASIVAKVTRDRIMRDLATDYPGYGWERNAGYGTLEHREALLTLGVTPHHRVSFKPIHNILYQEKN